MTDWRTFFEILVRGRQGYMLNLSYEDAVAHPGQDDLHRPLYMMPLPKGHPVGKTAIAEEWAREQAT